MVHFEYIILVTGCIRPEKLSRLNPQDSGGQYDSSGGAGGKGNPQGSVCLGYNHYVEVSLFRFVPGFIAHVFFLSV